VCEAAQGDTSDDDVPLSRLKVKRTLKEAFKEVCEAAQEDTSDDTDDDVPLSPMKVRRTLKGIVQS